MEAGVRSREVFSNMLRCLNIMLKGTGMHWKPK
jgi:hypothetical protein